MAIRRAVTALLFVQSLALAAVAQQSPEFRASGGEIVLTPKGSTPFSGSLQLSLSTRSDLLGGGSGAALGLTAGGTLIQDRLWFFGSASHQEISQTRLANAALPENATTGAVGARVGGQLASAHDFSAFFETARRPELSPTAPSSFTGIAPSSFLSLRYTGVVSSNMFFTATVTRSSQRTNGLAIAPVEWGSAPPSSVQ